MEQSVVYIGEQLWAGKTENLWGDDRVEMFVGWTGICERIGEKSEGNFVIRGSKECIIPGEIIDSVLKIEEKFDTGARILGKLDSGAMDGERLGSGPIIEKHDVGVNFV